MIKLAFKLASFFWLLAPEVFLVGRAIKWWDLKYDILVFMFLMLMFSITAYLNYEGEEK